MGVIKFKINSKIFYEDNEYIIKSYPSVDKVLLKQNTSPYKEIIVKVNDLIKDSKNANEPEKSQVEYEDKALDKATEKYKIIKPLLEIENRTKLLRPGSLDKDMLDEKIRNVLGLSEPKEKIFRAKPNDESTD